ncbi:hypothetical protein NEAUS03_2335 [Nematocida ausubeli]|nr:hypothetical protein NEAUS03_2335 [Nematocida ausubeli]
MNVLPMGFKNSPAIFQRIMDIILQEELEEGSVRVYIDDILIATKTYKHHINVLQKVLRKLKEHGMEINWDKVKLARKEITFLGHTMTENKLKPTDERITEVMKIPRPNTAKQVRSFLGKINYMGRHIYNLSGLKAPLNEFTTKGKKFIWEARHQRAFENLREAVAKIIAATIPNPEKKYTLETDASDTGIGAVLRQEEDVIGFYSSRLTPTQQRYTITERELYAVVWAMDRCKAYLLGKHFDVITDHKAIEAFFTKKDGEFGNNRIARWMQALENFTFTPKYKRGEEMIIPDGLSRLYEVPSTEKKILLNENNLPSNPGKEIACVSLIAETDKEKVIKIHEELNHRKSITPDLVERGINITSLELKKILESCRTCLERDNQFMKHNNYIDTTLPGELMGIDLMEYMNKYVVVMIDYFTRRAFTKELSAKTAENVKAVVEEVYKKFPFTKIIADNGKEFRNTILLSWLEVKGIDIHFRPPYYHEGTGRVERLIRTLRDGLNRTKGPLRKKLGQVTKAYNNTVHRAIGMSPMQAMEEDQHKKLLHSVDKYKREFGITERLELPLNQPVLVRKDIRSKDDKHFEEEGKIEALEGFDTYIVRLANGKRIKRNRSQIKPILVAPVIED